MDTMSARPMRAAIYCRVSSATQEDNSSLATQERSCREFAAKHGWSIAGIYRDVHTGAEVFERPGLGELRSEMRAGAFDVLVVHALDRLSRDQNHLGLVLSEAEHAGVAWASATEEIDNSPVGKMLRSLIAGVAEIERLKIKERTFRGKRARVESGRYNPGAKAPYGYRWSNPVTKDRLEIDPIEGPILRGIIEEIAAGGSLRGVASRLNREGIPTPTGRGCQWFATTVSVVISNPVVWGEAQGFRWIVEKRPGRSGRVRKQTPDAYVSLPDVAPAICEPELIAAVRARLERNRQAATRNNKHPEDALLRAGYAFCGYCGRPLTMSRRSTSNRTPIYRCNPLNRERFGCPSFGITCAKLDAAVWSKVEMVLTDPAIVRREVARLRRENPITADLTAIDRRTSEIDRKRDNLARRLAQFDDDELAAPIVSEITSLGKQRAALMVERERLLSEREGWKLAEAQLNDLEHWCRFQARNLSGLTYDQKRLALQALNVRATVWATDHKPRFEIKLALEAPASEQIVYTTPMPSTTAMSRPTRRASTG